MMTPHPAQLAPTPDGPTKDDRLLAAAAYLAPMAGFPIVGPCVIFAWKKDTSPFIANHALQALGVHVLGLVLMPVGLVLQFIPGAALAGPVDRGGFVAGAILAIAFVFLPFALSFALACWGAWRAFQGRTFGLPLWSALVARVMRP